jgi:hypothetical protein
MANTFAQDVLNDISAAINKAMDAGTPLESFGVMVRRTFLTQKVNKARLNLGNAKIELAQFEREVAGR